MSDSTQTQTSAKAEVRLIEREALTGTRVAGVSRDATPGRLSPQHPDALPDPGTCGVPMPVAPTPQMTEIRMIEDAVEAGIEAASMWVSEGAESFLIGHREWSSKEYQIAERSAREAIAAIRGGQMSDKQTTAERLREIHGDGFCPICGEPKAGEGKPICSYPHGMVPIAPIESAGKFTGFCAWRKP